VFCTTEFLPIGLLRYIGEGFNVSEGAAGLMVTAPGLLAAIAAPVITVAARSLDRCRILQALGLLLVVSNLMSMLAPSFGVLILARALFGIGIGGFWAIGAGLGGRLVSETHVGRATSIIFAGVSIGMLIGGPSGSLIGETLGWRAAFGLTAAISVIALLAQFAFLPSLRVERAVSARDLIAIMATPQGRIGLLAMTLVLCGQFATYTYVTPFLASISGFGGKTISSLLLGYTLIGLFGNFLGGAGAQRRVRATLLTAILFFGVPVALFPAGGSSQSVIIVLLAIWGVAYGAMPVALQMWMAKATANVREGGMALFVANFQISIALGSYFGGVVVDAFGLSNAMYFGAALGLLSILTIALFSGSSQNSDAA
jgi:predicted MFS family arabinose efflux permease